MPNQVQHERTAELLERALESFETGGWCVGWSDSRGAGCIDNHITRITDDEGYAAATVAVCEQIGLPFRTRETAGLVLGAWNDRQTSPAPVKAALVATIDRLRGQPFPQPQQEPVREREASHA